MPPIAFDLLSLALVLGMMYALMSEGLWGAATMFFNTLFAALISFNFYEPLAGLIVENVSMLANYADMLAMMLLFVLSLFLFRLTTETLAPAMVRFPTPVYHLGRLVFALGGALVTMAIIMLAFEVSPVQKKVVGVVDYKYQPFYKARFDKDWLAFFQYTSGYTFARNGAGAAGDSEFPGKPMLFDPRAEWLLEHQKVRPHGNEPILEEAPGDAAPAAPAAGAGAGAGAAGAPGGQGAPSGGGPGGANQQGRRQAPGGQ